MNENKDAPYLSAVQPNNETSKLVTTDGFNGTQHPQLDRADVTGYLSWSPEDKVYGFGDLSAFQQLHQQVCVCDFMCFVSTAFGLDFH